MGELFDAANQWLDQVEQTQDYTLPYVDIDSKTEPVRLNLMMSFWFYEGDQLAVREYFFNKVIDYINLTGVDFQREASVKKQRERKFRKEGFPKNWIEDIQKKKLDSSLVYYFSDQPQMSFAPKYGVKASFSPDFANNEWYSTVNFIFPFDFLGNSDKKLQCIEFFKSIVREAKIEQAYCGYRIGQPLDFTQAVPWQVFDTATAYRFLGLDIEKKSQTSAVTNDEPSLEKGVRSTAWLVYLGKPWLDKLEEIQAKEYANTPLQLELINDGIFFQADESPQLARIGLPRPQGYQALNNILKPIREQMLPLTQYADSLADWEPVFFQPEECDWWLGRWDRDDDAELLAKYPVPDNLKSKDSVNFAETQLKSASEPKGLESLKVRGGEACIKTGYWQTSAQPDSRQYFKEGEILPKMSELDWGEVYWYWDGE
ncbi:type VI immunity family protein [Acinetobacter sp. ESBL14]|uniref:type VI immunity family protein n=1 Tax=Acinetobacter sp. ESBL14 TaxID=3077329 RepID=UPI002FC6D543